MTLDQALTRLTDAPATILLGRYGADSEIDLLVRLERCGDEFHLAVQDEDVVATTCVPRDTVARTLQETGIDAARLDFDVVVPRAKNAYEAWRAGRGIGPFAHVTLDVGAEDSDAERTW